MGPFSTHLAELARGRLPLCAESRPLRAVATFGIPVDYGRRVVEGEMLIARLGAARAVS
jgi:hypothetical protein